MDYEWISAHIYFSGPLYGWTCDRIILEIVEPFIRTCQRHEWVSQYFFIRHKEKAPHVRLRLRGKEEVLRYTVKPKLHKHVRRTHSDNLRSQNDETSDDVVQWIPYHREINRYGGPDGVVLAERFFHCSSETCLMLLENCHEQSHSARLGKGLLAMVVLLYTFSQSRELAVSLMQRYETGYLTNVVRNEEQRALLQEAFEEGYDHQDDTLAAYVKEIWARLEEEKPLTDALDAYYESLCEISQRFETLFREECLVKNGVILDSWGQATGSIVPNYLHMTNNRLGIPIQEEAYLAHLLRKVLSSTESTHS